MQKILDNPPGEGGGGAAGRNKSKRDLWLDSVLNISWYVVVATVKPLKSNCVLLKCNDTLETKLHSNIARAANYVSSDGDGSILTQTQVKLCSSFPVEGSAQILGVR